MVIGSVRCAPKFSPGGDPTMSEETNVSELMLSAKHGDTDAFALLYQQFFTPVYRYVLSKLNDKSEAEDLAQTVFVRAFEAKERYQDRGKSPLAYFFTIARNLIINYQQKKRDITLRKEESLSLFEQIPDERKNPHEQIQEKEKNTALSALLKKLKPAHREIIELKFLKGYSNADIAKKTKKSEANVRQIQVRALRKLQSHLSLSQK